MWRTSEGDRILMGAEAALFADSLWSLASELVFLGNEMLTGVDQFDKLTLGQKINALQIVGMGLLKEQTPAIMPTAALEATIDAVYANVFVLIELEIAEKPSKRPYCRMIRTVCRDMGYHPLPSIDSPNLELWQDCISFLCDRILWDLDYEMDGCIGDLSPELATEIKTFTGIDPNYFTWIIPDLKDEQIQPIMMQIVQLCESVINRVKKRK